MCNVSRTQSDSWAIAQRQPQQHQSFQQPSYMGYSQTGYPLQGHAGMLATQYPAPHAYSHHHAPMDPNNPYMNPMWGGNMSNSQVQQAQYFQYMQMMQYAQAQGMPGHGYRGHGGGQPAWHPSYGYVPQVPPDPAAFTDSEPPGNGDKMQSVAADLGSNGEVQHAQEQAQAPQSAPSEPSAPAPASDAGAAAADVHPKKEKERKKTAAASKTAQAAPAAAEPAAQLKQHKGPAPAPAPSTDTAAVTGLEERPEQVSLAEPAAAAASGSIVLSDTVLAAVEKRGEADTSAAAPAVALIKGSPWGQGKLAFAAVVSAPAPAPAPVPAVAPASAPAAPASASASAPAFTSTSAKAATAAASKASARAAAPAEAAPATAPAPEVATPAPAPVELVPVSMCEFRKKCRLADATAAGDAPPTAGASAGRETHVPPIRRIRGLVNSGNTCFRNAILQCFLSATPLADALRRLVTSFRHRKEIPTQLSAWPELLGFVYSMQMSGMSSCGSGITALAPIDVRSSMPYVCSTFRRKIAQDGDEVNVDVAAPVDVSDLDLDPLPGAARIAAKKASSEHSRQEDAMEFLEFLMDVLLEEEQLGLQDGEGEVGILPRDSSNRSAAGEEASAAGDEQWEDASAWATISKPGVKAVVDNSSRQAAVLSVSSNLISRLFSIRIRSEITHGQRKTSANFTTLLHLSLALAYSLPLGNVTLTDALDSYFRENVANGPSVSAPGNAWGSPKDALKDKEDKKKEVRMRERLDSLPPVLIFQLKRFNYDRRLGTAVKVHRAINYPEVLALKTEYFSQDLADSIQRQVQPIQKTRGGAATSMDKTDVNYRLCGIVLHHGEAITSGHYTSIVATGKADFPYARINDVNITHFTAVQALSAQSEVYVLMYSKV